MMAHGSGLTDWSTTWQYMRGSGEAGSCASVVDGCTGFPDTDPVSGFPDTDPVSAVSLN